MVSFHVERLVGIIPPFLPEEPLQYPANRKFNGGGDYDGADEKQDKIFLQRIERRDDAENSEAVDRADRTGEKAAVYEFAVADGGKADLTAPTGESVYKEYPQCFVKISRHISSFPMKTASRRP